MTQEEDTSAVFLDAAHMHILTPSSQISTAAKVAHLVSILESTQIATMFGPLVNPISGGPCMELHFSCGTVDSGRDLL